MMMAVYVRIAVYTQTRLMPSKMKKAVPCWHTKGPALEDKGGTSLQGEGRIQAT